MDAISRQFSTRVIVLMPVAIAINIVLGATVQQALRLPIYLDSTGTIFVGVLAGPLAGAATGALSNLIWGYLLPAPIGTPTIAPFAVTAAVIGLLAGLWGRMGLFRSRAGDPARATVGAVVALGLVAALSYYTYTRAYASPDSFAGVTAPGATTFEASRLFFLGVMLVFIALVAAALVARRDLGAVYAIAAGLVTGIVAAIVSAPISAFVFGGVTGSGTDALVAAFRAAGASLEQATLQQGLLADPLDKMITSFLVFVLVANLSRRFLARFPHGDQLVATDGYDPRPAPSPPG